MDSGSDSLDSIRKELNKIVNQSVTPKTNECSTSSSTPFNNKIHPSNLDGLDNSETCKRAKFLETTASHDIDDDIQKMRSELVKSYELFQTAGEAFDSIHFNSLKYRIRDLHLTASQTEIDTVLEEKTINDSLSKLTDVMGHKFRQHPGEFGDIPELSTFFKACSQLQHGLDALSRQRIEMNKLGQRMCWATNIATERSNEIQKAVGREHCE